MSSEQQATQITSRAEVATDKPVAYMRQLCKHFGHKIDASFDDDSGHISSSSAAASYTPLPER